MYSPVQSASILEFTSTAPTMTPARSLPDQHFSKVSLRLAVTVLLTLLQLQVHVSITAEQVPLVLQAPFQLHEHHFPRKLL